MSLALPIIALAGLAGLAFAASRREDEAPPPVPPSVPAGAPPPPADAVFWHPDRGWLNAEELESLSEEELLDVSGRVNLADAALIGRYRRSRRSRFKRALQRQIPAHHSRWPGAVVHQWPEAPSVHVHRSTWPGAR